MSVRIKVNTVSLDFDIGDMAVELNCPECQTPNMVTIGHVQREETVTCTQCNKAIKLVDANRSVDKAVSDINHGLGNLKKALNDLGS